MRFAIFDMEGVFHVHSNYSYDGKLSLQDLRDECEKRNFQFMVVTDHAEDFSSDKVEKFIDDCEKISGKGFLAVPGLEFAIDKEREVHLLVVGLEKQRLQNGIDGILERVGEDENNSLAVLAHPSRSGHYIPRGYDTKIHGIEVWNSAYNTRYLPDHKAIRLFSSLKRRNPRLVGFGGLDLHDRSGFRGLRIRMAHECHTTPELLSHLKQGKFMIRGSYLGMSSAPGYGFLGLSILGLGRHVLNVIDFLMQRSATLRKLRGKKG